MRPFVSLSQPLAFFSYVATSLNLNPKGIAVDRQSNLYVGNGQCIVRIFPDGNAYLSAGGGTQEPNATNLPASSATLSFNLIRALVLTDAEELYIFSAPDNSNTNHFIFKWAADGTLTRVAGDGADNTGLYISDDGTAATNAPLSLSDNPAPAITQDGAAAFIVKI